MQFLEYLELEYDQTSIEKSRSIIEEIINNPNIPLYTNNGDMILDALRKEYGRDSSVYIIGCVLWERYWNRRGSKSRYRIDDSGYILHKVYEYADCYYDDGDLRDRFRRRPDLYLFAVIASGLFEIADAIRDVKKGQ